MEISVLACTDKGRESMSRIQREECLQLHNAPKKKKKNLRGAAFSSFFSSSFLFFSLLLHNQPASAQIRGIYSKLDWQRSPMPCKEKRSEFTRVILGKKNSSGKKHQRCPPETFLPVTKFLPGRRTCPVFPSSALVN